jgi:putative transposase
MLQVGQKMRHQDRGITVKELCVHFGYSRARYYQGQKENRRRMEQADTVLSLAHRERYLQPRLASDKVFRLIKPYLEEQGIKLGRDKLYAIFRDKGLLLETLKRQAPRTTNSGHGFKRYGNILKDKDLTAPNQAWVCDITYLRVQQSWMYLCLIMDAYSRKIVGWHLHNTLEMVGCMKALDMAMKSLPKGFDHKQLIHHSDHGVQYCCHAYRKKLHRKGIQISMAAVGDCYENAQAERLNGILKQEYGLGGWISQKDHARKLTAQAVELYNTRRPHRALGLHTPQQVHAGVDAKVKMHWPKKNRSRPNGEQKALEHAA